MNSKTPRYHGIIIQTETKLNHRNMNPVKGLVFYQEPLISKFPMNNNEKPEQEAISTIDFHDSLSFAYKFDENNENIIVKIKLWNAKDLRITFNKPKAFSYISGDVLDRFIVYEIDDDLKRFCFVDIDDNIFLEIICSKIEHLVI